MQKANVSAVETKCVTFSKLKSSITLVHYCVEQLPNYAFIQSWKCLFVVIACHVFSHWLDTFSDVATHILWALKYLSICLCVAISIYSIDTQQNITISQKVMRATRGQYSQTVVYRIWAKTWLEWNERAPLVRILEKWLQQKAHVYLKTPESKIPKVEKMGQLRTCT